MCFHRPSSLGFFAESHTSFHRIVPFAGLFVSLCQSPISSSHSGTFHGQRSRSIRSHPISSTGAWYTSSGNKRGSFDARSKARDIHLGHNHQIPSASASGDKQRKSISVRTIEKDPLLAVVHCRLWKARLHWWCDWHTFRKIWWNTCLALNLLNLISVFQNKSQSLCHEWERGVVYCQSRARLFWSTRWYFIVRWLVEIKRMIRGLRSISCIWMVDTWLRIGAHGIIEAAAIGCFVFELELNQCDPSRGAFESDFRNW